MTGGVYNLFLFQNNNNRPARNKLSKMGGIMSSSEELMNAAQPIVKTAMAPPTPPMTPPMAPPTPPMAPPSPMTPPMAPPSPMVPPPVPPMPPTPTPMGGDKEQGFFIGGAINAARAAAPVVGQVARTAKDKIVNITGSPKEFLKGLFAKNNETLNNAVLNKYGTLPAALTAGTTKINEATSSIQNSKNPEDTKKAITEAVDAPNTKEGLEETLQYVTGEPAPKNLSIDELNKRIMRVAMSTSMADPGTRAERFGKAVLLGLGEMKRTAELRAGVGSSKGGKTVDPFQNAVIRIAEKLIQERGMDADEAFRLATIEVRKLYGSTGLPTPGGPTPGGPSTSPPTLEEFLKEAKKANPNVTDQELTDYYNNKYPK